MSEFIPFRDRLNELARARWLRNYWLYRLLVAFAVHVDAMVDWCLLALYARYPSLAPPDALPVLGLERGIRRGYSELPAHYASRMLSWLTDRRIKGSPYALMSQVAGYLGDDRQSKIRVVNSHGVWYTRNADGTLEWYNSGVIDWDWDGDGVTKFSRYWVIVYAIEGAEGTDIWRPDVEWGSDDGVWGDGGVWGAEQVTVEQTTTMRAIIKEWNPPHAQCAGVLVTWEPNAFAPDGFLEAYGAGYPDGTWWRAGAFDTSDYVQTRVQGALFTGPVV